MILNNKEFNINDVLVDKKEEEFIKDCVIYFFKELNVKNYSKEEIEDKLVKYIFKMEIDDIIVLIKAIEKYTNKKYFKKIDSNEKRRIKACIWMQQKIGYIINEEDLLLLSKNKPSGFKLIMSVINTHWYYRELAKGRGW